MGNEQGKQKVYGPQPLYFHQRHGARIRLSNNFLSAERVGVDNSAEEGVVFTNRCLGENELFQIQVDKVVELWMRGVRIGVTTHNPNRFNIPCSTDMLHYWHNDKHVAIIWGETRLMGRDVTYGKWNLNNIQAGTKLGMKRSSNGNFNFYVNGVDQGVAAIKVPSKIWGVIDIFGDAVKVTIDDNINGVHSQNALTIVPSRKEIGPPRQEMGPLRFHHHCGIYAEVLDRNKTARRFPNRYNNGIIMTNRKLRPDEIFEVCIEKVSGDWTEGMKIGITELNLSERQFPATLTDIPSKTFVFYQQTLFYEKIPVKQCDFNLDRQRKKGTLIGVSITTSGSLHLYLDGIDYGPVYDGLLAGNYYGVVDVFGKVTEISVTQRGSHGTLSKKGKDVVFDPNQLHFNKSHGSHITLFEDQLTVRRDESQFHNGVTFTDRALEEEELLEIEIEEINPEWSGTLAIGVTSEIPDEGDILPSLNDFEVGTVAYVSGKIKQNGKVMNDHYGPKSGGFMVGDRVGVMISRTGQVHFLLNGTDLGPAGLTVDLTQHLFFGVIDVFGKIIQVSIVSREERLKQGAFSDKGGRQQSEAHAKLCQTQSLDEQQPVTFCTAEQLTIVFKKGSIADEEADVIVNSTSQDLKLNKNAASRAILEKAGYTIQAECYHKYPEGLQYGAVAVSSSGKINCKAIFHGAIPRWNPNDGGKILEDFIANILAEAHTSGMNSLAMPAIGTGLLNYPSLVVAGKMVDGIMAFSRKYPQTSLKEVRVVLFDQDVRTIQGFQEYIQNNINILSAPDDREESMSISGGKDLPELWTPMNDNDMCVLVNLDQSSDEYQAVEKHFKSTTTNTIIKIERVQNPNLYLLYNVQKNNVEKTITDHIQFPTEKCLFHGTKHEAIDSINKNGFNRSFASKNKYGVGVYFARDAKYSTDSTYTPPSQDGYKRMYRCLVITGEYTQGQPEYKTPPPKDSADKNILYNSVVDNVQDPAIFVSFHDANVYPEYLITFF